MQWLIENFPFILSVLAGLVSEGISVVQYLKYPTNSGVGGILVAIMKILQSLGAKAS